MTRRKKFSKVNAQNVEKLYIFSSVDFITTFSVSFIRINSARWNQKSEHKARLSDLSSVKWKLKETRKKRVKSKKSKWASKWKGERSQRWAQTMSSPQFYKHYREQEIIALQWIFAQFEQLAKCQESYWMATTHETDWIASILFVLSICMRANDCRLQTHIQARIHAQSQFLDNRKSDQMSDRDILVSTMHFFGNDSTASMDIALWEIPIRSILFTAIDNRNVLLGFSVSFLHLLDAVLIKLFHWCKHGRK